jgi:hypothetical protein
MSRCELFLDEHAAGVDCGDDGHRKALALRASGARPWSTLERQGDPRTGDWRDHLDGRPVQNGAGLELQAVDYPADDYGEFTRLRDEGVRVRYETAWTGRGEGREPVVLPSSPVGKGLQDTSGSGLFAVRISTLTEREKSEFADAVDELAHFLAAEK